MPQERYRKLLPNIPWYLSFKPEGQSVPCGPSWDCLFLGVWDFVGHLNSHPCYCHERFILIAVISSLLHCCLSLWKHFISICLVHSRTWCCTFFHTLQYSVFKSCWHSFSTSHAPSVPSLHFRNTFSLLLYMCMSYSSNLILSKSFASPYCFWYVYSFTDPYLSRTLFSHGSICFW